MTILAKSLSGHNLEGDHWNALNFLWENFSMGSMFVPNFIKIERGEGFFLTALLEYTWQFYYVGPLMKAHVSSANPSWEMSVYFC